MNETLNRLTINFSGMIQEQTPWFCRERTSPMKALSYAIESLTRLRPGSVSVLDLPYPVAFSEPFAQFGQAVERQSQPIPLPPLEAIAQANRADTGNWIGVWAIISADLAHLFERAVGHLADIWTKCLEAQRWRLDLRVTQPLVFLDRIAKVSPLPPSPNDLTSYIERGIKEVSSQTQQIYWLTVPSVPVMTAAQRSMPAVPFRPPQPFMLLSRIDGVKMSVPLPTDFPTSISQSTEIPTQTQQTYWRMVPGVPLATALSRSMPAVPSRLPQPVMLPSSPARVNQPTPTPTDFITAIHQFTEILPQTRQFDWRTVPSNAAVPTANLSTPVMPSRLLEPVMLLDSIAGVKTPVPTSAHFSTAINRSVTEVSTQIQKTERSIVQSILGSARIEPSIGVFSLQGANFRLPQPDVSQFSPPGSSLVQTPQRPATQPLPPPAAAVPTAASTAPAPINFNGGIHVQIAAQTIDPERAEETAHALAGHVLREINHIVEQDRFRRGLPTLSHL